MGKKGGDLAGATKPGGRPVAIQQQAAVGGCSSKQQDEQAASSRQQQPLTATHRPVTRINIDLHAQGQAKTRNSRYEAS